jgi:hypothetical protein
VPTRHIRVTHTVGTLVTITVLATGLTACAFLDDVGGADAYRYSGTIATIPFSGSQLRLTVENAQLAVDTGASSGTLRITIDRHNTVVDDSTLVVHDGTLALADPCPSGSAADCSGSYTVGVPAGVTVDVSGANSPTSVSGLATALTATLNPCASLKVTDVAGPLVLSCTGVIDSTGIMATGLDSSTVSATESAAPGASGGIYLGFDAPPSSVTASYSGGPREKLTIEVPPGPQTYRIEGRTVYPSLDSDPASSRTIRVTGGRMIGVFRWPDTWPPSP